MDEDADILSREAGALNRQAVVLQAQGQLRESLRAFASALAMYREAHDVAGEARSLNGIGAVYKDLGETARAMEHLQHALELRRLACDEKGHAITLMTMGPVLADVGRVDDAHKALDAAESFFRKSQNDLLLGQALLNQARLALDCRDMEKARHNAEKALELARRTGDPYEETKCVSLLGQIALAAGSPGRAKPLLEESLQRARLLRNPVAESVALHALGSLEQVLGRWGDSARLLSESLRLDRANQATSMSTPTQAAFAAIWRRSSASENTEDALVDAVATARRHGQNVDEAIALGDLAALHLQKRDLRRARICLQEAERAARHLAQPAKSTEAFLLQRRGQLAAAEGMYAQAATHYEDARRLVSGIDPCAEAGIMLDMGACFAEMGHVEDTTHCFEAALTVTEQIRGTVDSEDRPYYFQGDFAAIYYQYVYSLLRAYKRSGRSVCAVRAFVASERRRGRVLADALDVPAPDFETLQALLPPDSVLLEYSLHKDTCFLFVVSRRDIHVVDLEVSDAALRERVQAFASLVGPSRPHLPPGFPQASYDLYRCVLGPAEDFLRCARLFVVADGLLHALPFELLTRQAPSAGTTALTDVPFLSREFEIAYLPSASMLGATRKRPVGPIGQRASFVALAPVEFPSAGLEVPGPYPDLPHTANEVEAISALFPARSTRVLLRRDARKSFVMSGALSTASVVHFATHALVDSAEPMTSSLLLRGDDGATTVLSVREVRSLILDADLVSLSGCGTGHGLIVGGEGALSLAWAFLAAGAKCAYLTRWAVPDMVAADVARTFFSSVVREGVRPTLALKRAREDALRFVAECRVPDVFSWAAFTLLGPPDRVEGRESTAGVTCW